MATSTSASKRHRKLRKRIMQSFGQKAKSHSRTSAHRPRVRGPCRAMPPSRPQSLRHPARRSRSPVALAGTRAADAFELRPVSRRALSRARASALASHRDNIAELHRRDASRTSTSRRVVASCKAARAARHEAARAARRKARRVTEDRALSMMTSMALNSPALTSEPRVTTVFAIRAHPGDEWADVVVATVRGAVASVCTPQLHTVLAHALENRRRLQCAHTRKRAARNRVARLTKRHRFALDFIA